MDKNTITGFVLIGLILFGFTWYQSKQYDKQMAYQAQLDSIARVERAAEMAAQALEDSLKNALQSETVIRDTAARPAISIYKDSLLNVASLGEEKIITIGNDKIEVAFTTKGAQPYSAKVKDYTNYDSTDLYIFRPGGSEMGIGIYAGETINTKNFYFNVEEVTDSSVAFSLPFAGGGQIVQRYALSEGSYMMTNTLTFKGMDNVIPRNATYCDFEWALTIPRMEKGYKNEMQYSKLDYYFEGEKKPEEIGRGRNASKRIENSLEWFAFQQQFFAAIVRPDSKFTSGQLSVQFHPEDDAERNLMDCSAKMRNGFQIADNVVMVKEFYLGPNHYQTLKAYDRKYEKIIPLGGWLVG
ncbi:MAG: membrane protein insertase YidC, partial [Candidatus Cryptobacteroides sp.]